MIAIIHAYSRGNAGDSLLTDLTLERLARLGIGTEDCLVFALDAASFSDLPHVRQVGVRGRRPTWRMLPSAADLIGATVARRSGRRLRLGSTTRELLGASAIVGVAGGYLRAGDPRSWAGVLVNHMAQLEVAACTSAPTVYLPQSIGPLKGIVGGRVRERLAQVDLVCARDDRTITELSPEVDAERFPDLVVLHAAETAPRTFPVCQGAPLLVARELGGDSGYQARILALADLLPAARWVVQAEGVGSKDDARFYRRLGVTPAGRLREMLDECGVVVSVRLHGALEALAAGVPAIHLSYQRKGWSSYADLGLHEYVHHAQRFDPASVAEQVQSLASDPERFWSRFQEARPALLAASERLSVRLRDVLLG